MDGEKAHWSPRRTPVVSNGLYVFANIYTYSGTEYVPTPMGRVEYQSNENIRANLLEALVISNHLHSKTSHFASSASSLGFRPRTDQSSNKSCLSAVFGFAVASTDFNPWFKDIGGQRNCSICVPVKHMPLSLALPGWSKTEENTGDRWTLDFIIARSFWRQSFYELI